MSRLESDVEMGAVGQDRIQREYDWSQISPTTAVVETVAAVSNRDVLAMEPLADSVRVDALDDLFRAGGNCDPAVSTDTQLTLSYLGYRVTVRGDGVVVARQSEPSP